MSEVVSIIMGIYNCEDTLKETLDTVINQTNKDWKLIMCDDGSIDKTYQIAHDYYSKDNRIKLIKNQHNLGLAKTLNNCLQHATGKYIMRHDGDDLMVKDRIEKQVNYMNSHNCDACGSDAYLFDESGVWGVRQSDKKPNKNSMILDSPFIHPTVIIKRDVLKEVGGYSDNNLTKQRLEDYDLWIKLFEGKFILHNINEPLIYFRENKNSYDRKKKKYRITETRARLEACRRLNISYMRRVFALKPLIVMVIPRKFLRYYHIYKSTVKCRGESYGKNS
ncbi:MAG: glycosyltransferase family 2 protein [Eubacteriaceae bacterium]